jgi:cytochrome c peroxidase
LLILKIDRMRPILLTLSCIFIAVLLVSTVPILPSTPYAYAAYDLPAHFTDDSNPFADVSPFDNTPVDNEVTDHGATLGRVLFYDKALSFNNTVSCGSCHQQEFSFSDTATHSLGFMGGYTRRHSMPLINTKWHMNGKMFWDERAGSLEEQVLQPIMDPTEMGLNASLLIQRVQEQTFYNELFLNAFGDTQITENRISMALAQFVRSIVSYSSKYDIGRAQVASLNEPFPNFTNSENLGKNLFYMSMESGGGECFGCHTTEAFVNAQFGPINNGIDSVSTDDLGAFEPNGIDSTLIGRFKVSTLRNIAITAPYMHDGRFSSLEEVVEHYSSGIQLHPNLSPRFRDTLGTTVSAHQMNFSAIEKVALVNFLRTLTDSTVMLDVKWSDPFALTVGISDRNLQATVVQIAPNPAEEQIRMQCQELQQRMVQVQIYNSTGHLVMEEQRFWNGTECCNIQQLKKGSYVVRLQINDQNLVQRFIKS